MKVLDTLCIGMVKPALIRFLFTHPNNRLTIRQIAAKINHDLTAVYKDIKRLEMAGLIMALEPKHKQNGIIYKPNHHHPLYRVIEALAQE